MIRPIHRIALSTGGGDAPGLNAVIRAATLAARNRGWDVVGIRDGFNGIMFPEDYPGGGVIELSREAVRGIVHMGGTILGTTNRGNPTAFPVQQDDGTWIEVDRSEELIARFAEHGIDALITIGGDGSLTIGHHLYEQGLRVIGVPKTIDNDLERHRVDVRLPHRGRLRLAVHRPAVLDGDLARPRDRGRGDGSLRRLDRTPFRRRGGAHAILIPEIPFDLEPVAATIHQREQRGAKFSIVVVAEGATPVDGTVSVIGKAVGQAETAGRHRPEGRRRPRAS